MKYASTRDLLESIEAKSQYSTRTLNEANLVVVSSTIPIESFIDIVYDYDVNPSQTAVLRLEDRIKGRHIIQQIESMHNRDDINQIFAYVHKDAFDSIASNYQNTNYGIFAITKK